MFLLVLDKQNSLTKKKDKQNSTKIYDQMKTCLFVSGLTLTFGVAEIHGFLTDSS
jgi:hypothetical protein